MPSICKFLSKNIFAYVDGAAFIVGWQPVLGARELQALRPAIDVIAAGIVECDPEPGVGGRAWHLSQSAIVKFKKVVFHVGVPVPWQYTLAHVSDGASKFLAAFFDAAAPFIGTSAGSGVSLWPEALAVAGIVWQSAQLIAVAPEIP